LKVISFSGVFDQKFHGRLIQSWNRACLVLPEILEKIPFMCAITKN
jgi:hypothetical protein